MGYDATNLFEINPHFGTKQDAWQISVRFGQKIPRFKKPGGLQDLSGVALGRVLTEGLERWADDKKMKRLNVSSTKV